jgi:hypothetical protein
MSRDAPAIGIDLGTTYRYSVADKVGGGKVEPRPPLTVLDRRGKVSGAQNDRYSRAGLLIAAV